MYDKDQVTQIYEAHLEDVEPQRVKSTNVGFTDGQKKLIFGIFILFYLFVYVQKSISFNEGALVTGGIIIFIYFMNQSKVDSDRRPLTDREAKAIVYKELEWMQKNTGEIPNGVIRVGPVGRLCYIEGKAWKRQVGAEIERHGGGVDTYIVEIHPFFGDIIGMPEQG